MLPTKHRRAASREFDRQGVQLTIQEPVVVERKGEPVTSGLPLPEGKISDVKSLALLGPEGKPVPCQFTPLCSWPQGSVKWVLLDFQADATANKIVTYTVKAKGENPTPPNPVSVKSWKSSQAEGFLLDSGPLQVGVASNLPGLVHSIRLNGVELLDARDPVQTALMSESNGVFRASRPKKLVVECDGPMRAAIFAQGDFVSGDGNRIFGGKVGYDLRITAYAGKPYVKLAFTLRNDGWYGYRNEHRPRQWLYFRSLNLQFPIESMKTPSARMRLDDSDLLLEPGTQATQWYMFPDLNHRFIAEFQSERELLWRRLVIDPMPTNPGCIFYWSAEQGTNVTFHPDSLAGWAEGVAGDRRPMRLAVRRFRENYPSGFLLDSTGLSFLMFPPGGYWPITKEASDRGTYQFEGGRHKTAELLLDFGIERTSPERAAQINHPLFARADARWYGDTGAVLPFAARPTRTKDKELREAWDRYDLIQKAKVKLEYGDLPGPHGGVDSDMEKMFIWRQKVSIPYLWEEAQEVFMGSMNYGDLVWSFGYCSVFYEWPYTMLQSYLRLGDREFFDVGDDMVRHRYDIDQYHVEDTEPYLAGFQRYEKGEHGNLEHHDQRTRHWELNCSPSHTWNRDLLLHWALTGDPLSKQVAEQNGRAFERYFYGQLKLAHTNRLTYGEFRTPGWAIENWLALYEYTGDSRWLQKANEIFDKTLLAMEQANGGRGHILPKGHQDIQFVGDIVEPVCRLHHCTGRPDVAQFLRRVLTWQRTRSAWGYEKEGGYYPTRWQTHDWDRSAAETDEGACGIYSWLMMDGYAYVYRIFGRKEDIEFARKLFRESVFYFGRADGKPRSVRTPLGFHYLGTPVEFHAAKMHAWTGRYGQLYMVVDAE